MPAIVRGRTFRWGITILSLLVGSPYALSGEVDVLQWTLGSVVDIGPDRDADLLIDVVNPLTDTLVAAQESSSVVSSLSGQWDSVGHFAFDDSSTFTCQGGESVRCFATGTIYMSISSEAIVSLEANLTYDLSGGGDRDASVTIALRDLTSEVTLDRYSDRRSSIVGQVAGRMSYRPPSAGIVANHDYAFFYMLELTSHSGIQSAHSEGNGHVSIEIVPVPEPGAGTLALFLGALLQFWRRRV